MQIESINEQLIEDQLLGMEVRSFDADGRRLVLAFSSHGGPRESEEFLVELGQAIIFHLPSVLHAPVVFRRASEEERERLIPPTSYDRDEVSGTAGAYTVLTLNDLDGTPTGYYVAADTISASWRKRIVQRLPD